MPRPLPRPEAESFAPICSASTWPGPRKLLRHWGPQGASPGRFTVLTTGPPPHPPCSFRFSQKPLGEEVRGARPCLLPNELSLSHPWLSPPHPPSFLLSNGPASESFEEAVIGGRASGRRVCPLATPTRTLLLLEQGHPSLWPDLPLPSGLGTSLLTLPGSSPLLKTSPGVNVCPGLSVCFPLFVGEEGKEEGRQATKGQSKEKGLEKRNPPLPADKKKGVWAVRQE